MQAHLLDDLAEAVFAVILAANDKSNNRVDGQVLEGDLADGHPQRIGPESPRRQEDAVGVFDGEDGVG